MPLKCNRSARNGPNKDEVGRELRQRRLTLLIQQFEEEARENMKELETKMENMLATVDKVFKVELMKMPPSLQNTRIGDLISEEDISVSVMKTESSEPLKRKPSKRVKSIDSTPVQRSSSKTSKGGKGTKKTRTLVSSNNTGNPGALTGTVKRTRSCLTTRKTNDQTTPKQNTPKLRSVVSAGDVHCSLGGSAAHVTVTTAKGLAVSFSDETKDQINWDVLDDVAWCQIQKLKSLMEYLSQHSRSQQ